MKFETIILINNNLTMIKNLNKLFSFEIAKLLDENLDITNKLINNQNIKLNSLVTKYGDYDGFDYVVTDPEKINSYNQEVKALYDEEIDLSTLNMHLLSEKDLRDSQIDLTTVKLLMPLIKKS